MSRFPLPGFHWALLAAWLFTAGGVALAEPSQAEAIPASEAPLHLHFNEVVKRARSAPPSVRLALQNAVTAKAQADAAAAQYLPKVTVEGQYGVTYRDQPIAPPPNLVRIDGTLATTTGTLSAEWLVTDFGSRYASVEAAKRSEEAAQYGGEVARNDAARTAGEMFVQVVADKAWLLNSHENVTRREAQFRLIEKLVLAGLRPNVDAVRAKVDLVAAERAVRVAEAQLAADRVVLSSALGLDPNLPIDVSDADPDLVGLPSSTGAAVRTAEERRAELGRAHKSVAASEQRASQAARARLPTLSLTGSGQVSNANLLQGQGMPGNTYQAAGAVVARWSALDVVTWRNARVARESLAAQQQDQSATSLRIRTEAAQSFFAHQKAQASYEQATQVLASAAEALRAQSDRYRAGIASLLELLDAQNIEQQARGNVILAKRDVDLSRVRLLAACGVLGQSQ